MFQFYEEEKTNALIFLNYVNSITFLFICEKYLNMLNDQFTLLWAR